MFRVLHVTEIAASLVLACLVSGCSCDSSSSRTQPSAVGSVDYGLPPISGLDPAKVAKILNPKGDKPYQGPTGTLTGMVKLKGDPPPTTSFKYRKHCEAAVGTYGSLFRVGQDQGLADVLVAVTGHGKFVPYKEPAVKLTIKSCAYSARTIALTYGQHLEILNDDSAVSHLPHLDGARQPALNVAVQKGLPIKIYPREPSRYWLRDKMGKKYMVADVFTLRYSTHGVTDLNGRYEIQGIPVGEVEVNAVLPAIMKTAPKQKIGCVSGSATASWCRGSKRRLERWGGYWPSRTRRQDEAPLGD